VAIDFIFEFQGGDDIIEKARNITGFLLQPFRGLSGNERLEHERDIITILISTWRIKGFV